MRRDRFEFADDPAGRRHLGANVQPASAFAEQCGQLELHDVRRGERAIGTAPADHSPSPSSAIAAIRTAHRRVQWESQATGSFPSDAGEPGDCGIEWNAERSTDDERVKWGPCRDVVVVVAERWSACPAQPPPSAASAVAQPTRADQLG